MNTSRLIAGCTGAGLAILTLSATAGPVEPVPRLIGDEVARCVNVVRDTLVTSRTTNLHHTITRIEVKGNRRAFTISSAVYEDSDLPSRQVTSRCLAERWGDGAELEWQRLTS